MWRAGLLWRAGLPRVGLRSSPIPGDVFLTDTPRCLVLGLLRSPTRGKPARHNRPARHKECGRVRTIPYPADAPLSGASPFYILFALQR